jgi:hypothetical protein
MKQIHLLLLSLTTLKRIAYAVTFSQVFAWHFHMKTGLPLEKRAQHLYLLA